MRVYTAKATKTQNHYVFFGILVTTKRKGDDSMKTNSNLQGSLVRPVATDDHSEKTQGRTAEESKENPLSF